jgi:hypothetical protein
MRFMDDVRRRRVQAVAGLATLTIGGMLAATPARAELLYAINTNNQLFRFDHTAPAAAVNLGTVTLDGTQTPLSMDFRATDGNLYILGSGGTIFTINPNTAALISTVSTPYPGGTIVGENYEIDFNPVPNALRIVNSNGQNLRVAGGPALNVPNTDTPYPGTITPVGVAYNNNDINPGTGTTLFALDDQTDSLIEVGNPNNPPAGALTNRGTLGAAISGLTPFDISQTNTGYMAVGSTLYSVDVTSPGLVDNRATSLGVIGAGAGVGTIKALSAATAAAPEPGTLALLGVGLLGFAGRRLRRRA